MTGLFDPAKRLDNGGSGPEETCETAETKHQEVWARIGKRGRSRAGTGCQHLQRRAGRRRPARRPGEGARHGSKRSMYRVVRPPAGCSPTWYSYACRTRTMMWSRFSSESRKTWILPLPDFRPGGLGHKGGRSRHVPAVTLAPCLYRPLSRISEVLRVTRWEPRAGPRCGGGRQSGGRSRKKAWSRLRRPLHRRTGDERLRHGPDMIGRVVVRAVARSAPHVHARVGVHGPPHRAGAVDAVVVAGHHDRRSVGGTLRPTSAPGRRSRPRTAAMAGGTGGPVPAPPWKS